QAGLHEVMDMSAMLNQEHGQRCASRQATPAFAQSIVHGIPSEVLTSNTSAPAGRPASALFEERVRPCQNLADVEERLANLTHRRSFSLLNRRHSPGRQLCLWQTITLGKSWLLKHSARVRLTGRRPDRLRAWWKAPE